MQSRKFPSFAFAAVFCSLRLLFSFAAALCSPTSVSFENLLLVFQLCAADFQTRFLVDPLHHNNSCRYPWLCVFMLCLPFIRFMLLIPDYNSCSPIFHPSWCLATFFLRRLHCFPLVFFVLRCQCVGPSSASRAETVSFSPLPMKF